CADLSTSVAEDEFVEALRCVNSEPLAGLSSHGEAAKVNTVDMQRVEKIQNIVCKKLDGVTPGSGGRLAMATRVVAEEAVTRIERRKLRIPHGESCAERIGKNEDRSGLGTSEGIVDTNVAKVGEGHGLAFCGELAETWTRASGLQNGVGHSGRRAKVV